MPLPFALLFAVFCQAIIVVGSLIYGFRSGFWRSNLCLALFVVGASYLSFLNYLVAVNASQWFLTLFLSWNATGLCLGPLFYLYVEFLLNAEARFRPKHLIFLAPPIAMGIVVRLTHSRFVGDDSQPVSVILEAVPLFILQHVYAGAFIVIAIRQLRRFNAYLKGQYSNLEKRQVEWLKFVLGILVLIWVWNMWSTVFVNPQDAAVIKIMGGLVFLSAVLVFAVTKTLSFENIPVAPSDLLANGGKLGQTYAKSGITNGQLKTYGDQIQLAMQNEKMYLNADLKLPDLAGQLHLTPPTISQVLSQHLGKNFYDFVNEYRVKHACNLLRSSPDQKVLSVAYDSGFNSKSTFNNAFKKAVGLTPKEYRDRELSSQSH